MLKVDLSKVKEEYLAFICLLLIGVIAFIAYKNAFGPLLGEIKDASIEIEQKKMSIQRAQISPQAFKKLEDELREIKTKTDYYDQSLRATADVPQILKELNQIAERLKIRFVSVSPLAKEEILLSDGAESLLQIPIRLKLQCGYHQLGIFVNQIENSPRFTKITQLSIDANAKNIWTHQIELVITSFSLVSKNDYTD